MSKQELIDAILSLDADTFQGIDDPSYLDYMSVAELERELAELEEETSY